MTGQQVHQSQFERQDETIHARPLKARERPYLRNFFGPLPLLWSCGDALLNGSLNHLLLQAHE